MNRPLPQFAIDRPVTVCMLVLTLLILGAVAWRLTPVEFMMRVDEPFLWVNIPYPGAAPSQVENEVTIPAEGEFKTIPGLERIFAYSNWGGAGLSLRFDLRANMATASAEVRDRIERLKLKLPPEIEHIAIHRWSTDQTPIMHFALFRETGQEDLAHLARTRLKNRLLRIDGVADVAVSSETGASVYVDFDQNALRSMNLGIAQVVSMLQTSNINVGLGKLDDGGATYFVRAEGELRTPEELADVVISPNGVRLKDVARVHMHVPDGVAGFTVDGKRGVFISVRKESEANTVETCDRVREALNEIPEDPDLADTEMLVFGDQSKDIRFALGQLTKAGQAGSVLAFAVLVLFLRRLRPTLIVALMTPASLVCAFVYVYLTGRSLNMITIAAMLVSLGMLVDNAIVVVENIHRYRHLGFSRRESALRGASEVSMAITASSLTTIVVFVPVMYMDAGMLSIFMREFSGPVTVALLASLILSLTVLPLAESRIRGSVDPRTAAAENGWWAKRWASLRLFERFRNGYGRFLDAAVTNRNVTLGALALLLAATYQVPFQNVGLRQIPNLDMRQVTVRLNTDPNYGYENVKQTVSDIEIILNAHREEFGIKNLYINQWGTGAEIKGYLVKEEDLGSGEEFPMATEDVKKRLAEMLPEFVPGARINCGVPSATPIESQTVSVRLRGDDTETVDALAESFRRVMESRPEFSRVRTSKEEGQEEIQIRIDEARTASAGATPMSVARTVNFALSGAALPYMKREGREVAVSARFQGEDRRTRENLDNVMVQGSGAQLVPLQQLVSLERAPAPRSGRRENGKSVSTISGETEAEDLTALQAQLRRLAADFELPRGYSLTMGDEIRRIEEDFEQFQGALIMAVILIYLVMAALFESFLLPLSILTTVALAFVGVYWSLWATGTPMDTVSLVGSILMCGIIVNNGIVIVDHINQLRREGSPRPEAIVQAGLNRFRPVMMTSLTTILGCIPLAIGGGEASGALNSLGRAFVGGLTAGTLLTLVIVPIVYTIIDDLQLWFRRYCSALMTLRRASAD